MTREELEAIRETFIESYATRESVKRVHDEDEHEFRFPFQRDRDRVIHSASFRRLQFKTQMFKPYFERDFYRSRLTHTIEATQIARTIATALRLDVFLAEAIVIAHDLGHAPFGHAAERKLNELTMPTLGGFDHNYQAIRVVTKIEDRYSPQFEGLNLTLNTLEGVAFKDVTRDRKEYRELGLELEGNPSLEAQVADVADDIAHCCHDIDDGLYSRILRLDEVDELTIWRLAVEEAKEEFKRVTKVSDLSVLKTKDPTKYRYRVIRKLINLLVTNVIETTRINIDKYNIKSYEDVRNAKSDDGTPVHLVDFDLPLKEAIQKEWKKFKEEHLLNNSLIVADDLRAEMIIDRLFDAFQKKHNLMPKRYQNMTRSEVPGRVICDYISGMTDIYAEEWFGRIYGRLP